MSAHETKSVTCHADLGDGDVCDAELTFEDHATFVQSPRGEDRHGNDVRDRFESSAIRFDCPDCGASKWVCPVCTDHLLEDPPDHATATPGWFVGESTGDRIACHNCNQAESARQMRQGRGF